MTTIVWDSRVGVMASDSQMTEGEDGASRKYRCRKLYEVVQMEGETTVRRFVGLAGDPSGLKFLRWVREGMDYAHRPDFRKNDEFSAIVVTIVGHGFAAETFDATCEPEPVTEPYCAIGSGSKAAYVLLDAGFKPWDVIERVARRCPYTDRDVQVLTVA
jgi:hypothetical protein